MATECSQSLFGVWFAKYVLASDLLFEVKTIILLRGMYRSGYLQMC